MDSSKRRRISTNSTPFLRSFIGFRRSLPKRRIKRFIGDLFMVNDQNGEFLGKEKIFKLMLKFCVPCVLSLLVSALYNIVDQIFVGNSELSTLGNAATGVVFPIFIIAQGFAWYFGDGCAAFPRHRRYTFCRTYSRYDSYFNYSCPDGNFFRRYKKENPAQ